MASSVKYRSIFKNIKDSEKIKQVTSPYKINGYDSAILEERAYLDLQDDIIKLEYRINTLEENLSLLYKEIAAADELEDTFRSKILNQNREKMEKELKSLMREYNNLGVFSMFSGFISSIFKPKKGRESLNSRIQNFLYKYIFSKLSKRMNFTFNLRISLEKLSNIIQSVDELISMQTPAIKNYNRYDRLIGYVNKANEVHAQINKDLNVLNKIPQNEIEGKKLDIRQV